MDCGLGVNLGVAHDTFYNAQVFGYEKELNVANIAKTYFPTIAQGDINTLLESKERYDYILLNNTLSKCFDPYQTIHELRNALTENGAIVILMENITHHSRLIDLLNGTMDYRDMNGLSKDVVRYFTYKQLSQYLQENGYVVELSMGYTWSDEKKNC